VRVLVENHSKGAAFDDFVEGVYSFYQQLLASYIM
jgi:hypothetical protein